MPSAPPPPYWYVLNVTSSPLEVGKLVAPKMPPIWSPVFAVSRRLPLPWTSLLLVQLSSGGVLVFPLAVRQAAFVAPFAGVGLVAVPVPSTVRLLKAFWNSTVPAANARAGLTTTSHPLRSARPSSRTRNRVGARPGRVCESATLMGDRVGTGERRAVLRQDLSPVVAGEQDDRADDDHEEQPGQHPPGHDDHPGADRLRCLAGVGHGHARVADAEQGSAPARVDDPLSPTGHGEVREGAGVAGRADGEGRR